MKSGGQLIVDALEANGVNRVFCVPGESYLAVLDALDGLLDEWTPVIEGAELGEHPYDPITPESRRRAAAAGDDRDHGDHGDDAGAGDHGAAHLPLPVHPPLELGALGLPHEAAAVGGGEADGLISLCAGHREKIPPLSPAGRP